MEEIKDERFSHITSDPRFRTTPKSIRKVKIDKRFQSLFTDKRFQVKYTVDKRGRPSNQSSQENYRKYYDVSDDESSDEESEDDESEKEEERNVHTAKKASNESNNDLKKDEVTKKYKSPKSNKWIVTPTSAETPEAKDESSREVSDTEKNNKEDTKPLKKIKEDAKRLEVELDADKVDKARLTDDIKMKLRDPQIDYARGVGALMSDSSSEEESSVSDSDSEVDHGWGELDRDAEVTDDATTRLAVLHMDWDRIRAVDLMVLFNSFLPQDGVIRSVTVYPSQFGLERMKEEEERGPIELVNAKAEDEVEVDEESKEGRKYHTERLRQYQLNRLKYYYAIVEFDSVETANKVYSECDGLEYESSATKLDLRFVPEDESFDQEPREVCTSMPDPTKYEPRIFTNTALQQGKVELTWDETDPGRQEFTRKIQKNADKIDDVDLQAYLASSSGEEEDEEAEGKEKSANESDSDSDQENMKEEDKIAKYKSLLASIEEEEEKKKNRDVDLEITWGVGLKEKAEKSVKEKLNAPQTPFEEMLDKRRKKKKLKREEKLKQREKNKENDSEDDLYSDDDLPSDVDMDDPYFKEEMQSTKGKKKKKTPVDEADSEEIKQKKAELELLLMEENDGEKEKSHFNMKKIQEQESESKKKKRRKQLKKKPQAVTEDKDEFKVDVADDRFSALFTSHHFNVDPAEPQFRKTKAMEAIISEKLKRRREQVEEQEVSSTGKKVKTDTELTQLVNKIKSKTKNKVKN